MKIGPVKKDKRALTRPESIITSNPQNQNLTEPTPSLPSSGTINSAILIFRPTTQNDNSPQINTTVMKTKLRKAALSIN